MTLSLLMLSTTDAEGGRADHLARMLDSVARHAADLGADTRVRLLLLAQRAEPTWTVPSVASLVAVETVPGRLSLSAARNRLLAQARASGALAEADLVLFPDDDCWYPDGVLAGIADVFRREPALDLWFCRYRSQPEPFAAGAERPARVPEVTRRASSNTVVVRASLLADGLGFDEDLGVGTPNNGGEDTAFALRVFGRARTALFNDRACIGHRDPDRSLVVRYYRGTLLAIARSANISGIGPEFLRKLCVGLVHVARGKLGLWAYLRTAGSALAAAYHVRKSPVSGVPPIERI